MADLCDRHREAVVPLMPPSLESTQRYTHPSVAWGHFCGHRKKHTALSLHAFLTPFTSPRAWEEDACARLSRSALAGALDST